AATCSFRLTPSQVTPVAGVFLMASLSGELSTAVVAPFASLPKVNRTVSEVFASTASLPCQSPVRSCWAAEAAVLRIIPIHSIRMLFMLTPCLVAAANHDVAVRFEAAGRERGVVHSHLEWFTGKDSPALHLVLLQRERATAITHHCNFLCL